MAIESEFRLNGQLCQKEQLWPRWVLKKANWEEFTAELEERIGKDAPVRENADQLNKRFTGAVLAAASAHIPKLTGKGKKKGKCWWSAAAEEAAEAFARGYAAVSDVKEVAPTGGPPRVRENPGGRDAGELMQPFTMGDLKGFIHDGLVKEHATVLLSDRKARARVNGATSKYHTFKEGCPQGTVLGPLCWLIFIDDLRQQLKDQDAELFMYADDVCIAFQGGDITELYKRAQKALDALRPWAQDNSVQISLEKTSVTAFSPDAIRKTRRETGKEKAKEKKAKQEEKKQKEAKEGEQGGQKKGKKEPEAAAKSEAAKRYPGLKYGDETVKYEQEVRFLGLWLDDVFSFTRHVEEVRKKINQRMRVLKSVSGTSWGCRRANVRMLYLSLMQSCVDFALPAYAPFVPAAALKPVREVEKEAAMHISGC
eukprot:gene19731-60794_t